MEKIKSPNLSCRLVMEGIQNETSILYNLIFKKQRVINSSLIQALRKTLQLNQQLLAKSMSFLV